MKLIDKAAIIGGGVIGAGWIARLIENGIDVTVYDPADDAAHKVEAVLKNRRHAYAKSKAVLFFATPSPRPWPAPN